MDTRDAKIEVEIDEKQKQMEASERIATSQISNINYFLIFIISVERNTQQEQEYEAAELAHEARKDRAIGAAQCGGGAVDVGRVIKKGVHNVEAIKKGEIRDIKFIGVGDVKVNDQKAVLDNVKVKGKAGKAFKIAGAV